MAAAVLHSARSHLDSCPAMTPEPFCMKHQSCPWGERQRTCKRLGSAQVRHRRSGTAADQRMACTARDMLDVTSQSSKTFRQRHVHRRLAVERQADSDSAAVEELLENQATPHAFAEPWRMDEG